MKKLAIITKTILFLLIGIILFFLITPIFIPKMVNEKLGFYRAIIQGFYAEPKNSLDVVILGDSSVYKGISPIKMWEEYGFTSYNFASPSQKMWDNYYCLKEVIKYQKPKVIVLNIDQAFTEEPMVEMRQRFLYNNMPDSINKVKAIMDPVQKNKKKDIATLLFPMIRFHGRWSELKDEDFLLAYSNYYYAFKGYQMTKGAKPYDGNKNYMQKENKKNKIGPKAKEYLTKMIETCRENKIQLLFIETPAPKTWNKTKHREMKKWAIQNNIPFFDMNLVTKDLQMDWNKDTTDKGYHMNILGAEKISKCLGNYLKAQYQLPNHKEDANYKQWEKDTQEYEFKKQELYQEIKKKGKNAI